MPGLTKRAIDALRWDPEGPAQQVLYDEQLDGKLPGFGVRVYDSGKKSFVLWYRTRSGRKRLATVGRYGVMTLAQARQKAKRMLLDVDEGKDPVKEERRQEREVQTFRQLADRWLEEYAKPHRTAWPEDKRRLDKRLLPALGRIMLEDLDADDVRVVHAAIGKKAPVEANRCVETVRAIWRWAEAHQLLPAGAESSDAFRGGKHARIKRFRERSRERWLTAAELRRLAKALAAEEDLYAVAAIRLLLLTGCRKTELLRARWDRLDVEGRRLLLEDTKTGEAKVVPLSEPALAIVQDLPRMLHSPWIFPSPKDASEPRDDIRGPWQRVRAAARIPDATVHDLRRTAGSWLVQKGVPTKVIQQALGHRDARATEIYTRIAATQPAEALEMLGEAFGGFLAEEA